MRPENSLVKIFIFSSLSTACAFAGPRNVDIQENVMAYDSDKAAKVDHDYLSPEAYSAQLAAANNFADLKAVLIKAQKSDAAKVKASKDTVDKEKKK